MASDAAEDIRPNVFATEALRASMDDLYTTGQPVVNGSSTPETLRRYRMSRLMGLDPDGFRLEDGSESSARVDSSALMGNILLENPEAETRWYFKYFLGQDHTNYLAVLQTSEEEREQVLLSVMADSQGESDKVRAILWRKSGSERLLTTLPKAKAIDAKKLLMLFGHGIPDKRIVEVKDAHIQDELLVLEEQEGAVNFKIGILYGRGGQMTDDEMFSNETGSPAFDEFVALMGEKHPLRGWTGFRGGLDVKSGSTGEFLVHTVEFGKEIVFHVSTLLPHSKENPQQLERKRHLGNDISNIIFQEDAATPFNPDLFKSKFIHIFAVVSPLPTNPAHYQLRVFTKNSVPEYGPALPNPSVFTDPALLRHFLIVKLMNGEKAALASPVSSFARKKERTLDTLIQHMHGEFDRSKFTLSRTVRQSKGRAQAAESFRQKGQALKVTKIAAGAAPTSTLSTQLGGDAPVEPWTPVCITSQLLQPVLAADMWESDLVYSTVAGVHRMAVAQHDAGALEQRTFMDGSSPVVQLTVDEHAGLLFVRAVRSIEDADEAGRSGQMYAMPLEELETLAEPISKKSWKKYAMANTKGCHLFAFNSSQTSTAAVLKRTCKIAVALGRKVLTFQYLAKNPGRVPGLGSGGSFQLMHEFALGDHIEHMIVADIAGTGRLLCGLRSGEFTTVDLGTEVVKPVGPAARAKARPDSVLCLQVVNPNVAEDVEFLLCTNQTAAFKDADGNSSRPFDVKFSSRLEAIAHVYPYLIGFTQEAIELVTLINGSLVKTLAIPNVRFLSSKRGIFFTGPTHGQPLFCLYRISDDALAGKAVPEDEMGSLPRHIAPGNVFARKMSAALVMPGGDDSPAMRRSTAPASTGVEDK